MAVTLYFLELASRLRSLPAAFHGCAMCEDPATQAIPEEWDEDSHQEGTGQPHRRARPDVTKVVAKEIIQSFLDSIIDELAAGNRLEFREFGVFETKERAARRAQNPRTLEKVSVPAKRIVKFKVGRLMRKRVSGDDEAIARVETGWRDFGIRRPRRPHRGFATEPSARHAES